VLTGDGEARRSEEKQVPGTAIVIASDASGEAIADMLRARRLKTRTVGRIEEIADPNDEHGDPSVVVLQARDPSASLARLVGTLKQRFEVAPVIVVCDGIERWGVRAALSSGAAGVVLQDELDSAFGACLQAVLAGQTCVPRAHRRQIEPPALSSREKQILGLVVMGYMNSQIAQQLFLAESTVKSHLSSAFGKLGVRSRNEAVNLILDPGRGLGMGILGLGGEPLEVASEVAS
jgi:DNA-binding NarL/FixJ family response regulator